MNHTFKYITIILLLLASISYFTIYNSFIHYAFVLIGRTIGLVALMYFCSVLFHRLVIKNAKIKESIKNIVLILFSFLIFFFILEIAFTFISRSHSVGYAYAVRNWQFYHKKLNTEGYRDVEWGNGGSTRKQLVFIGDSFTEGAGIKQTKDRFPDIIARALAPCYDKKILAKGGMSSTDQLAVLEKLKSPPKLIVYQYYGNDIEGDALQMGFKMEEIVAYKDLNILAEIIVRSSYLFNYFYWIYPRPYLNEYSDYLLNSYSNPKILTAHTSTIQQILAYAEKNGSKMYCVVIPYLQDLESSKSIYENTINHILSDSSRQHIINIPIQGALKKLKVEERIVNNNDPHASEKVHAIIAKKLLEEMSALCPQ